MRQRVSRRSVSQAVYARIDADIERAREAAAVKEKGAFTPPPAAPEREDTRSAEEMARAAQAALRGGL